MSCPYRKSHPLAREAKWGDVPARSLLIGVPIVNLIRWRRRPNRAMFPPDVGRLQIDLVAADRVIPIESDA